MIYISLTFNRSSESRHVLMLCAIAGTGDRVLCFCCGGGVKSWQPEEDPWEEHAKHYPG